MQRIAFATSKLSHKRQLFEAMNNPATECVLELLGSADISVQGKIYFFIFIYL